MRSVTYLSGSTVSIFFRHREKRSSLDSVTITLNCVIIVDFDLVKAKTTGFLSKFERRAKTNEQDKIGKRKEAKNKRRKKEKKDWEKKG